MHPRRSSLLGALLAATLLTGLLGACSSDASTRAGADDKGPTTTAAPVTVPETIPAGTKLRIGDQLDYLKTILKLSGQDQDLPYDVEYASFVGGPPMLQAFKGGAIDSGFVASTPLIFAQAAKQDIVAVAGWAADRGLGGLVTVDPSIKGWKDLKGKRVAYQRGTSAEAAVLTGLSEAGLKPSDITTVDVPITQISAALQGGSADAGLSTEPLISLFLAGHPDAKVAAVPGDITDRGSFLIASKDALADEGKTAALADYASRLVKAFAWLKDHPDDLASGIFVKQYGLSPERAKELVAQGNGSTKFFALPGDILKQQQKLADLFVDAGQIPAKIDVSAEFDNRFNDLILAEQGK
ncbi:ABC transporter substrate-binding protein [Aquihabitans sp. G128]|uniref:ABC transporter substrate-binding protein n=1 Tax=Aquihabitans sp. G128 TaxID=2849779 RepID=UPI001C21B548|nr:ABC transporter substrate-binding protein [Aquihabitans sp. G128]QXC59443.1 ABC transporter substrate-binding protein [Aquihabitans sp. G128]